MFDSIKGTWAYRTYRHSRLYDAVRRRGKVLKRAIKLPQYLGTEYQCPVCGVGLRAFRPAWKSYISLRTISSAYRTSLPGPA